jgi:DNA invertase Pin-like site-specific DNA recombinase
LISKGIAFCTHYTTFGVLYRDHGENGTNLDRSGLRMLLDNVRTGIVKRVIVSDLSRLARSFVLTNELMILFFACGVEIISFNDGGIISHADFPFTIMNSNYWLKLCGKDGRSYG